MGVTEWNGLAWWEQRLLREGLEKEFGEGSEQGGSEDTRTVFSGRKGEMSRLGFTEHNLS
jgi:hypothetical protein